MIKLLYLDYISLLLYAVMISTLITRPAEAGRKRAVFSLLLIVALYTNLYDVCAVLLDNTGRGAIVLKYIMHCGYLLLRGLVTPLFGAYIIAVTDTWHKLSRNKYVTYLIWVPYMIAAAVIISSPFTHFAFYLDADDTYTRGPYFLVLYVASVFYMVFAVVYTFRYYRTLKIRDRFAPLFSIVPYQIAAAVIQYFFPHILCEMFCTSMCILFMMLTVEKPSGKTDPILGVLKSSAFYDLIIVATGVSKPMTIILINMTNHVALGSYMDSDNMDELYREIVNRTRYALMELNIVPILYSLDNGLFAVVLYDNDMNKAGAAATLINEHLSVDYMVNKYTLSVFSNVGIVNLPSDVSDVDSFRILAKKFRVRKYNGDVITLSGEINTKDYKVITNIDTILKNAIDNDLFEVYYQPIYSIKDKKFHSAEALIRLNTPEYGFIRPDLFIPAAEDSGAIHEIGMIVLDKVCKFIDSEEYKALDMKYIEVNLSVIQCMDRDLAFKIFNTLDKYNIHPSQINLEITETASTIQQKSLTENIERLHNEGLSFSLDDFGTGYSNMARIASLPLTIVKLDRTFTNYENDSSLKIILDNSVSMLKKSNMEIVVEGVETKDMVDMFEELKCDYIQGYYFSKPLPEKEFIEFLHGYENTGTFYHL